MVLIIFSISTGLILKNNIYFQPYFAMGFSTTNQMLSCYFHQFLFVQKTRPKNRLRLRVSQPRWTVAFDMSDEVRFSVRRCRKLTVDPEDLLHQVPSLNWAPSEHFDAESRPFWEWDLTRGIREIILRKSCEPRNIFFSVLETIPLLLGETLKQVVLSMPPLQL